MCTHRLLPIALPLLVLGCPQQRTAPPPPGTGDAVRGGALYDKWWAVTGAEAPTTDHPLWADRPDSASNTRTGPTTWRCKECHGWDYQGVGGAYGGGSHRTGFAGVLGTTHGARELVPLLRDHHRFGDHLSDGELDDIIAFLRGALLDTRALLPGKRFAGDAAAGERYFTEPVGDAPSCAACHGADGRTPPPGAETDFDEFPGRVAAKNPWELLHKIRFGHPGSEMPAALRTLSVPQLADLGAYLQTLPSE